jgi:hypothetical protein
MYPEIENQILKNQPWTPLYDAVAHLFDQLRRGEREALSLSFGVSGYGMAPYVQATMQKNGWFRLELVSNVYLEPNISPLQRAQVDGLGWNKPNGLNPNYWKEVEGSLPADSVARYLVTTLRVVFELKTDAWFSFGTAPKDIEVASRSTFWHRLGSKSEVCLPDQNHSETVEGIS